tara:strand:- start:7 stop:1026 length:1020 start_codon:yes stop_codon:yes gene_type:complete
MFTLKNYKKALIGVGVTVFCSTLLAQTPRDPISTIDPPDFNRTGQTGFQFLHLPTNARSAAMGGIMNGMRNSTVSSIFNNPANLVDVKNIDAAFTNISYVADISYMTAAVAKNLGSNGTVGLFFANLTTPDMVRTQNTLDQDLGITVRSADLGTFKAGDVMYGISYAKKITDMLSVGGNFSRIEEDLAELKVSNTNIDFGLYYETGFNSLRLSMVARNFGPDTEFTGFTDLYGLPQTVRMPINFRVGIGYDLIENLSVYAEGAHPNDGPERFHLAGEYNVMNLLSLRGGYKMGYDEQSLTFGGGLNFNMGGVSGRVDYAFLDYGRLSNVSVISIGFAVN